MDDRLIDREPTNEEDKHDDLWAIECLASSLADEWTARYGQWNPSCRELKRSLARFARRERIEGLPAYLKACHN